MNKTDILQHFNEAGIWIPGVYVSKHQCHERWKNLNNSCSDGNSPHDYATKDMSMIEAMEKIVGYNLTLNDKILELGCNSGSNLNYLSNKGYRHLYALEINKNAIAEMKASFPNLKAVVWNHSLETCLKVLGDDSFDLVFSMAVLLHIHPGSNFIFDEIARISSKYICTVESETCHASYIFERNYKRVFEKRGYKEIACIPVMPDKNYTLRLFEKTKHYSDFPLIP